jgi:hypothetical protein
MPQRLRCSSRPLLPYPFLPGSWPCLSIKLPASRLCLFLATSLAKRCFYRVSKLLDGTFPPFQETLICVKGSAAASGRCCRTRFCQVPGHACRLIKLPASRLCLFLARSLAKCCFYRVSKLMDGIFPPLQETLRCLKGSAAAFGRRYHSHFCRVPGHAWRLSCSSFQSRLLPYGFFIAFRNCCMASFLLCRKPLHASKALLQL